MATSSQRGRKLHDVNAPVKLNNPRALPPRNSSSNNSYMNSNSRTPSPLVSRSPSPNQSSSGSSPNSSTPSSPTVTQTINLNFLANQSVGIHFRWVDGFFTVDGFTETSTAVGKVKIGFKLTQLNGISLKDCKQKVVVNMMKGLMDKVRVLTFSGIREIENKGNSFFNNEAFPKPALLTKSDSFTAKLRASTPPIPKITDDKSTPARRRRIIYEIVKGIWKGYKVKGMQNAIHSLWEIKNAKIIQRVVRVWLGRRFLRLLRKKRRFDAAVLVEKQTRGYFARRRYRKLKMNEVWRRYDINSTFISKNWRMIIARRKYKKRLLDNANRKLRKKEIASITIQTMCFRGPKSRIYKQNYISSVTKIQAIQRGISAREKARLARIKMKYIVLLQSLGRQRHVAVWYYKARRSLRVIQRFFRNYLETKDDKELLVELLKKREIDNFNESKLTDTVVDTEEINNDGITFKLLETPEKPEFGSIGQQHSTPDSIKSKEMNSPESASPPKFQLRFDPDTNSENHTTELFGLESPEKLAKALKLAQ